jgi:hypothetical protein
VSRVCALHRLHPWSSLPAVAWKRAFAKS